MYRGDSAERVDWFLANYRGHMSLFLRSGRRTGRVARVGWGRFGRDDCALFHAFWGKSAIAY